MTGEALAPPPPGPSEEGVEDQVAEEVQQNQRSSDSLIFLDGLRMMYGGATGERGVGWGGLGWGGVGWVGWGGVGWGGGWAGFLQGRF